MSTSALPHQLGDLGVILVAAGRGERLGAPRPKAFVELDGQTLLERSVRTILALPTPGHLAVVIPDELADEALELINRLLAADSAWQVSVVAGGNERDASVRGGLAALPDRAAIVLVHDAARPLTPAEVFVRVIAQVRETGEGAVPGVPVADTLKRIGADGIVHETVDRATLVAVQTPQGFPRELLEAAHAVQEGGGRGGAPSQGLPTDDAEVVQRFGGTVRAVAGSPLAHKLTTPADLRILQGLLREDTL